MRLVFSALALCAATWCDVASAQAAHLYEATIETGMPHLEENLRYATTHSALCLGGTRFATAFPILHHVALKGCRLDHEEHTDNSLRYTLSCGAGSETTGTAQWQIDTATIHGTLDVRLGAKNMTFYQRITGKRVGDCVAGD